MISGLEFLLVLSVIGVLFLLSLRMRARRGNIFLLAIIAFLLTAMSYLVRLTMALMGGLVILLMLLVLFAVVAFAHQ